jgi:hypothetical protein
MGTESLRDFIAHHDDRWLFVAVYITLAVVLSMMLSLFWLVAVAGLHFALEYLRQAQYRSGVGEVVSHALWEIKLDIALVLLALALALYIEVVLGVLGLQSAARAAAATRVARFAAWERNLRAVVLLADDAARVVQVGVSRLLRRPPASPATPAAIAVTRTGQVETAAPARSDGHETAVRPRDVQVAETARPRPPAAPPSWRDRWSTGDRLTVGLLAASLMLIVVAPMLTDHSWHGATLTLLAELHPFPPAR